MYLEILILLDQHFTPMQVHRILGIPISTVYRYRAMWTMAHEKIIKYREKGLLKV